MADRDDGHCHLDVQLQNTRMNTWPQWLVIHAGGRREVLRRLVPELLRKHIDIHEFHFHWDADQLSLRLYLSPENNRKQTTHQIINKTEDALDAMMALYPWEERPLLDWTEEPAPRKLSVMFEASLDKPQDSCIQSVEDRKQICHLLEHDGAVIKEVWVRVLRLAFNMYPELRVDCQMLLERIPVGMRERIPAKLTWLEKNTASLCEEPLLWKIMSNAMQNLEAGGRQNMLQRTVDCLGFRPDEQAYLVLIASTIKQMGNGRIQ